MKTPSLRTFSALFATGALITMLAGTSCDAEVETEDLELEELEALEAEDLDERSGGEGKHDEHHDDDHDDHDDDHDGDDDHDDDDHHGDGEHHGDKCDPHHPPKAKGKEIDVWPPNHKMRHFDVEDCLKEVKACDDWEAEIIKITSDEPVDGKGDGNTAPDIVCDEDEFSVRAERSGKKDGRVYDVYIKVKHGHHHKHKIVVCEVEVDHDQGPKGDAVDSGDAYEVWCSDGHDGHDGHDD